MHFGLGLYICRILCEKCGGSLTIESESRVGFCHFIGGYSSALFLGALGFFSAGISKNSIAGYMVSIIYYISNFFLKEDLGNLYLFSMSAGSFREKNWLLGCSFGTPFIFPLRKRVDCIQE